MRSGLVVLDGREFISVARAAAEIDSELFDLAIEVCAFEPGFFGYAGHAAVFACEVKFEIGAFEFIARLAQGAVEQKGAFCGQGHGLLCLHGVDTGYDRER